MQWFRKAVVDLDLTENCDRCSWMLTRKENEAFSHSFESLTGGAFISPAVQLSCCTFAHLCQQQGSFSAAFWARNPSPPLKTECLRQTLEQRGRQTDTNCRHRVIKVGEEGGKEGGGRESWCSAIVGKHYLILHACLMWNQGFRKNKKQNNNLPDHHFHWIGVRLLSGERTGTHIEKHTHTRSPLQVAGSSAETCIPLICA